MLFYHGDEEIANFTIEEAQPFYDPATLRTIVMVLVIITIYGQRHAVQYEVAGKGFIVQCMAQVAECRFFKPGALPSLEAYIMALAYDQRTLRKGVYFSQTGWHRLGNGNLVFVSGGEVIGELGDLDYKVSPKIEPLHLVYDPDLPIQVAVRRTLELFTQQPSTIWPVIAYRKLTTLRSLALPMGLTTFVSLYISGRQGYGKTYAMKHYGLLYDKSPDGEMFGCIGSNATPKGAILQVSKGRDLFYLLDDLPISSSSTVQKHSRDVIAETLRFVSNDTTRETASSVTERQSQRAVAGVGYTGEIPLKKDSDLTRVFMVFLDHPMSGGSERDRIIAASEHYAWLKWFVKNAEMLTSSLRQCIASQPGGPDSRFRMMLALFLWITNNFLDFAEELGIITAHYHSQAMESAKVVFTTMLKQQNAMIVNKPLEGNLAYYIQKGYENRKFHVVKNRKDIHKLLKSAFSKAVLWGYTKANPTTGATLPTAQSEIRAVWSDEEAVHALSACELSPLRTCLYLGLGCSMRLGEILGLQWSNVHFSDPQSEISDGYLRVDRELNRISNESIEALERVNRSNILFKFPRLVPKKATTTLVLKEPKTESSKRTIYLPKAVEEELRCVRAQQEDYRRQLGEEYKEFDLVIAQINGHPYEQSIIARQFKRFIKANGLRPVVFHSLRHSSTSLKLKLSHGDIKAVQGDTGHAQARMVTDTYAHGFDTDRKLIAREMDAQFFSKVQASSQEDSPDSGTLDLMRSLAQKYPELLIAMLKGEEPTSDK